MLSLKSLVFLPIYMQLLCHSVYSRALGYICNILFIYLWLRWVSSAAYGLSLVAASVGLLIAVASLVAELGMWPQ